MAMVPRGHLHFCRVAAFLHCWTLFIFGAQARPFVLLHGADALPDDDTTLDGLAFTDPRPDTSESVRTRLKVRRPVAANVRSPANILGRSGFLEELPQPTAVAEHTDAGFSMNFQTSEPMYDVAPPRPAAHCRDVRQEVVIESGLQGVADVFSEGRIASLWAPRVASSTEPNFILPTAEKVAVFVIQRSQGALVLRPSVAVSDPAVLSVELAQKQEARGAARDPVVLIAKHICRKAGVVMVTVAVPLQKNSAAYSPTPLCPGRLAPIVFAYWKACSPPSHTRNAFMKALSVDLPAKTQLLAASRRNAPVPPWKGIVPTGGVRTVFIVLLVLAVGVVIFEFSTKFMSRKMRDEILTLAPLMTGCEATMDYCSFSFPFGQLVYTMKGLRLKQPVGAEYTTEYFLQVEEVKVWFNVSRIICSWGNVIEIRQLVARDIGCNIEFDGYVFGEPNIKKVQIQMDKRNKLWIKQLEEIHDNHGIDAAKHWKNFSDWGKGVAERVILKEATIHGIGVSCNSKAGGVDLSIADRQYHDFSEQHDAVGARKIGFELAHALLSDIAEDVLKMGPGQFDSVVSTVKGWAMPEPEHPQMKS